MILVNTSKFYQHNVFNLQMLNVPTPKAEISARKRYKTENVINLRKNAKSLVDTVLKVNSNHLMIMKGCRQFLNFLTFLDLIINENHFYRSYNSFSDA